MSNEKGIPVEQAHQNFEQAAQKAADQKFSVDSLKAKVEESAKVLYSIPGFVDKVPLADSDYHPEDVKLADEKKFLKVVAFVWVRLGELGIYPDVESHKILLSPDCAEGEARRIFCEDGEPRVPVARFKRLWNTLKGSRIIPDETKEPETLVDAVKELVKLNRPVGELSDKELLQLYAPDCNSKVESELKTRSNDRPCIIFTNEANSIVDVDASLRMLKEARRRETPIHYQMADCLKKVYHVGEFPSTIYGECPLHPDVLLTDGYCDECGQTWEGVADNARQFARLVEEEGEAPEKSPDIRQLIAIARREGIEGLSRDYPKIGILFGERDAEGKLPVLKRRTATNENRTADPFNPGSRRY